MSNPVGRPLKFKNVEEFEKKANDYFVDTSQDKWSITGLALYLDTFRDVLMDYEIKDEFSNAIRRAKQKVEMAYEMKGVERGNAFDIFRLKNMGWKDKTETDITTKGEAINTVPDPTAATAFAEFLKSKK